MTVSGILSAVLRASLVSSKTTCLKIRLPSSDLSGTNEGERFFLFDIGEVMFSEIIIYSSFLCMDLVRSLSSSI